MQSTRTIFLKLRMFRRLRKRYKLRAALRRSIYLKGYRYCMRCRKWFKTEQRFCPICNKLLRWSPRDGRYRRKYNAEKRAKYVVPPEDILRAVSDLMPEDV